jgi:hypothetical protein
VNGGEHPQEYQDALRKRHHRCAHKNELCRATHENSPGGMFSTSRDHWGVWALSFVATGTVK